MCLSLPCATLGSSFKQDLRTINSLRTVTLPKIRRASQALCADVPGADRAPKRVGHAGEITHAVRARERSLRREDAIKIAPRKAVPIAPARAAMPRRACRSRRGEHLTREYSARDALSSSPLPIALRESFAKTFRESSYRVSALRYFVCLVRFALKPPCAVNSS